jgi:hypothetical protein
VAFALHGWRTVARSTREGTSGGRPLAAFSRRQAGIPGGRGSRAHTRGGSDEPDRLNALAVYRLEFGQASQEDVIDYLLTRLGIDRAKALAAERVSSAVACCPEVVLDGGRETAVADSRRSGTAVGRGRQARRPVGYPPCSAGLGASGVVERVSQRATSASCVRTLSVSRPVRLLWAGSSPTGSRTTPLPCSLS